MKAFILAAVALVFLAAAGFVSSQFSQIQQQKSQLVELQGRVERARDDVRGAQQARTEAIQKLAARGSDVSSKTGAPDAAAETPALEPASESVSPDVQAQWIEKAHRLQELASADPEKRIPELELLSPEEWLITSHRLAPMSDSRALLAVRSQAKQKLAPLVSAALGRYAAANDGRLPSDIRDLVPLLDPSVPQGALDRYELLASGRLTDVNPNGWLVGEKSSVDGNARRMAIGPGGTTGNRSD